MPEVSATPETHPRRLRRATASDLPALSFVNVSKTFADGTAALSNISFDVRDGEFVTIVGPSGCGKSTLLKIASKLIPATAARSLVDGRSSAHRIGHRRARHGRRESPARTGLHSAFRPRNTIHVGATTARGWPISGSGIPSDEPVNAWDNALAESFFASLKNERVHHMVYPTRKKAKDDTMATKGVLAYFDALTA